MVNKIILILIFSSCSGFFYYFGGEIETKIRDLGIPLLCYLPALYILNIWSWLWCLISALLLFGALTTYWDWLTKLWRGNEDEYWENWLLHGLFIGLASLPLLLIGIPLWVIGLRAVVLGVTMAIWSEVFGDVIVEDDFQRI